MHMARHQPAWFCVLVVLFARGHQQALAARPDAQAHELLADDFAAVTAGSLEQPKTARKTAVGRPLRPGEAVATAPAGAHGEPATAPAAAPPAAAVRAHEEPKAAQAAAAPPLPPRADRAHATALGLKGSCRELGCSTVYSDTQLCHCTPECITSRTCCSDFGEFCMPAMKVQSHGVLNPTSYWYGAFWAAALVAVLPTLWIIGKVVVLASSVPKERGREKVPLLLGWTAIAFEDDVIEREYDFHNSGMTLKPSSRLLAAVLAFLFCHRVARIADILAVACLQPTNWGFLATNVALAACLAAGCVVCWYLKDVSIWARGFLDSEAESFSTDNHTGRKNFIMSRVSTLAAYSCESEVTLYSALLLFTFFCVPAVNLSPFAISCWELKAACMHDPDKHRDYATVDCALSGPSSMAMLMTWVLLQPWLILKLHHMAALWPWLLCVYIGWTFLFRSIIGEVVHDTFEILIRSALLGVAIVIAHAKKYSLAKSQRLRFWEDIRQMQSNRRIFSMLAYMVPEHVIKPLLQDSAAIAVEAPQVTVMFIIIVDFPLLADTLTPRQLLEFLNKEFSVIDKICKHSRVTKIETVGEEYVACVGVMPEDQEENEISGHQVLLERLLLAADTILQLQDEDEGVEFKIGLHTGPVVAGVVGSKLPRYRLFGDTMNTAARMMQKGQKGHLQLGEATYSHLGEDLQACMTCCGEVELKGKGPMMVYNYKPNTDDGDTAGNLDEFLTFGADSYLTNSAPMRSQSSGVMKALTKQGSRRNTNKSALGKKSEIRADYFQDTMLASVGGTPTLQKEGSFLFWPCAQLRGIMPSQQMGFSPEVEEEWQLWYHTNTFCYKAARRFGLYGLLFVVSSAVELALVINWRAWMYEHPLYPQKYRWAVFVYSRGVVLFINLVWWYGISNVKWVQQYPRGMQVLATLSTWLFLVGLFISYDAAMFSHNRTYLEYVNLEEQFRSAEDQVLGFFAIFFGFMALSLHRLHFSYAVVLILPPLLGLSALLGVGTAHSIHVLIYVCVQMGIIAFSAHGEEVTSRARYKALKAMTWARERTEQVLDTLLPPLVSEEMRSRPKRGPMPAHQYRHTMLAQSDLCGFTAFSASKKPHEVVSFLGELFGMFDELTDKLELYKVETVGDAYIAGMANKPLTAVYLPANVILFGLHMVRATAVWSRRHGISVTCRVGVHYGECIGGIVGYDMQRYHLFGKLLGVLQILESTSLEGWVQVSHAGKEEVERHFANDPYASPDELLQFAPRDEEQLHTSKGEVLDIQEVGGPTYLVESSGAGPTSQDLGGESPPHRGSSSACESLEIPSGFSGSS